MHRHCLHNNSVKKMTNVQRTTNQLFPGCQRHRQRLKAYENNGFSLADVRPPTKTIFTSGQAKKAASENNFHSRHLNRPTSENVFRKKKLKSKSPNPCPKFTNPSSRRGPPSSSYVIVVELSRPQP